MSIDARLFLIFAVSNYCTMKKLIFLLALILTGQQIIGQSRNPEPVAGKAIIKDYITQNLVYPESDLQQGNSGKVVVGIRIDKDGNPSDYSVISTFSEAASPVAIALVKTILWKPALHAGMPIDCEHQYPVEFNAKSYKRYWKHHERPVLPLTLEADDSNIVYDDFHHLEQLARPYFADGSNIGTYIAHNLKFPAEAKEREIQGTVRLSFVVETDGSVSNIVIINSVGGGCDNEAIRLMQETHWLPAEKDGKYVRSRNMQDITFNIGSRNFQDGNSY